MMTTGANAMNIEIEKTRLNAWNVGGLVVVLCVNAFALGGVYVKIMSTLEQNERFRTTRTAQTDANFAAVNAKLAPLETIVYQMAQNEKRDDEQDKRVDRIVDSFGGKLDALNDNVNALRVEVKVVAQKVDLIAPTSPNKRAELTR